MYNLPEFSDLSISEGSIGQDLKKFLYSYNDIISKLTSDLELVKKNQSSFNDSTKIEHKSLSLEIEKLKKQLLAYQTDLGTQTSKLSVLEKEATIFNTPNSINGNAYSSADSTSKSTPNDQIDFTSLHHSGGNIKTEENLNFFIILKLFENTVKTAKNISQIHDQFENFKNEITSIFTKKEQTIESLTSTNRNLEEMNNELKTKLMSYEEESNKGKFCIYCHKTFIPKFNEDKSCVYHPGKLKYYSCRGCGGDEYFNCCMKCSKCSSGCKTAKHIGGL